MNKYEAYRKQWEEAGNGKIKTEWPTDCTIELASVCDSRCIFCPVTPNYEKRESLFPVRFMKFGLFKKIIDEISGHVLSIKLQYRGESTLHKEFNKFCDYAAQAEFIERMINTNGNYHESKREGLYKLDKIIFSIDSLIKEKYEKIRKGLSFLKLMKNFGHAVMRYQNEGKPKIKVNMTITKDNKDEIEQFRQFFNPEIVELRQAPVFSRTPNAKDYSLNLQIIGRKNCKYPSQRQIILHSGLVLPCCAKWEAEKSDIILGDASKQNIYDIWHNKKTDDLQITAIRSNYSKYKACMNCEVWPSYEVIDRDKLYGLY